MRAGGAGRSSRSQTVGGSGRRASLPDIVQVHTTVDSKAEADRLAAIMIEARLAACVQIQGPIASVYRWQGHIEHATEWRCAFKTTKQAVGSLRTRLVSEHRYDVPEILVTSAEAEESYAEWIVSETGPHPPDSRHQPSGGNRE